jgi:hypothetical protein
MPHVSYLDKNEEDIGGFQWRGSSPVKGKIYIKIWKIYNHINRFKLYVASSREYILSSYRTW